MTNEEFIEFWLIPPWGKIVPILDQPIQKSFFAFRFLKISVHTSLYSLWKEKTIKLSLKSGSRPFLNGQKVFEQWKNTFSPEKSHFVLFLQLCSHYFGFFSLSVRETRLH